MADIEVHGGDPYEVTVTDGSGRSQHRVRVPDGYLDELGVGDADPAAVVRASFAFLLERESKEQIMQSFDLPVIERYFPEYPDTLPDLLDG